MTYVLISSNNRGEFVTLINDKLKQGYKLYGDPFTTTDGYLLNQAMVIGC